MKKEEKKSVSISDIRNLTEDYARASVILQIRSLVGFEFATMTSVIVEVIVWKMSLIIVCVLGKQ